MEGKLKGHIHSLETFGLVDGPGVRFVVFMQGCRMRCAYCHNPETWALSGGTEYTAEELFQKAYRYRRYWGKTGGITVSGGEPLLQIDFLTEFFEICKAHGVHTTLDTAGNPYTEDEPFYGKFERLMRSTDLIMLDIKEMDSSLHKELTGVSNGNILRMAEWLSGHQKDMWIRHVLVPGVTDQPEDLEALHRFAASLKTLRRLEVLPYHTMAVNEWKKLGIPYRLDGVPQPTAEEVARAESILHVNEYYEPQAV
ncbi:MAG: pyruvate formate-lyase-activating protein [Eubacteriales bacterium]|nr:pyruvate formate-lyase-activating protein [Eubacteriales bacterium]